MQTHTSEIPPNPNHGFTNYKYSELKDAACQGAPAIADIPATDGKKRNSTSGNSRIYHCINVENMRPPAADGKNGIL